MASLDGPDSLAVPSRRCILRRWRAEDRVPFAAMNADPVVMEHYPAPLSRDESDAFVDRIEHFWAEKGWGLWAVELSDGFAGYVGLLELTFAAHFTPAVEVGWRLDRRCWGQGIATEAARSALADGFGRLGFDEIVSVTATTNIASQRVMQKLGMRHDPAEDFDHPHVAEGRLRRHVLYRLPAP